MVSVCVHTHTFVGKFACTFAYVLFSGLLLRLFHHLYNCDVVEEEVYHCWKEDIAQEFPGKEKALFQVRERDRGDFGEGLEKNGGGWEWEKTVLLGKEG